MHQCLDRAFPWILITTLNMIVISIGGQVAANDIEIETLKNGTYPVGLSRSAINQRIEDQEVSLLTRVLAQAGFAQAGFSPGRRTVASLQPGTQPGTLQNQIIQAKYHRLLKYLKSKGEGSWFSLGVG